MAKPAGTLRKQTVPSDCSVSSIDFRGSLLTTGSYADQFHVFTVEWTKTGIYYYVDNVYIGGVTPPNPGGFWKLI